MGWLDFLKFGNKVEMAAQPISVSVTNAGQLKRNAGRIVSLYEAISQGDTRDALHTELAIRLQACVDFGHGAPLSLVEAKELFDKVNV